MSNSVEPKSDTWCIHFTGVQNKTCKAGISYQAMWDEDRRLPCILAGGSKTPCSCLQAPTPEQVELFEQEMNKSLDRLLNSIKTGLCPHCHKALTWEKQVGRCVYGSCGCRLWQGRARTKEQLQEAQAALQEKPKKEVSAEVER